MNKFNKFYKNISEYYSNNIVTNFSPSNGYRYRCEFGYYDSFYLMHKNDKKIYLETFENAATCIQELMPKILNQININESVKEKLFQINHLYYSNFKSIFFKCKRCWRETRTVES